MATYAESFAAGIPTGFATAGAEGSAAAPTVTHDAATPAADLAQTVNARSFWDISSWPLVSHGTFTADVELTADPGGVQRVGLWIVFPGAQRRWLLRYTSGAYSVELFDTSSTYVNLRTGSQTTVTGGSSVDPAAWSVGSRRTLTVKFQTADSTKANVQLSVDGQIVLTEALPQALASALTGGARFGVYLHSSSVKVRSVTMDDALPSLPDVGRAGRSDVRGTVLLGTVDEPRRAPGAAVGVVARYGTLGSTLNIHYGGKGSVSGLITAEGFPKIAQVRLLDRATSILIAETRSAADGSYRFDRVRTDLEMVVVAYDPLRIWAALIADAVYAA